MSHLQKEYRGKLEGKPEILASLYMLKSITQSHGGMITKSHKVSQSLTKSHEPAKKIQVS